MCVGPEQGETTVDFRRGKRFHKLYRLMSTGKAQAASWRFKWHSVGLWVVLVAVCAACFVGLRMAIDAQVRLPGRHSKTENQNLHAM